MPQDGPKLSPLIAPEVKTPHYIPSVVGAYGFQVPPEMSQRVSNFLTGYSTPKRFESVVIVPNDKWGQIQFELRTPIKSGRAQAFSNMTASRAYLNADSFKELDPNKGVEWLLAHELRHYNDPRAAMLQQRFDKDIDSEARDSLAKWLKMNNRGTR
jgi:hypothetical protein